jgi:hypothetical protein
MNLHGDVVDFPYSRDGADYPRRPRKPVAAWLLVALIGVVLGGAAVAASLMTDTRDFATRHGTVLATRAL